jgi:hypothetical protein
MNALVECYPDGVPVDFPAELFGPVLCDADMRRRVDELQARMLAFPQAEIPTENIFCGGVYARKITIPKGALVVGRVHLTDHFNLCLSGDLTVATVNGPVRIKAPAFFTAPAGTKKVAFANEETVWINLHPDTGEDADEIVSSITVDTYADFDALMHRASLVNAIERFGLTEEVVATLSADPETFDPTPIDGVSARPSLIDGTGLFADKPFSTGDLIAPGMAGELRTLAGRYSNHSALPNAEFEADGRLFALRDIAQDEEITTDYGKTLSLFFPERSMQ